MTKDEAIERLVRTMKLALDAGTRYFYEHPMFIQNVETFKQACDALFVFSNPIKIGIATRSLHIADTHLEQGKQYTDLAHAFHIKKIKNIELKQGVSVDELRKLLSYIALPLKDMIQKGGLTHILQQENISHVTVSELDYSELLYGEGEEIGDDLWSYLLCDAAEKQDIQLIGKYAHYFTKTLQKGTVKRLIENNEVRENIQQFFATLHAKDESNYRYCAKELLKSTVKEKLPLTPDQIHQLTSFIKDLQSVDFADTLWEEIVTDEHFDTLSFNLFSQLTEEKKHHDITTSLAEKIQHNKSKLTIPRIRKRIKELFSDTSDLMVPEMYRHLLTSALHDTQSEGDIIYDRDHIYKNYCYILLDLLSFETNANRIHSIVEKIVRSWNTITEDTDIFYLKKLQEVIAERSEHDIVIKSKLTTLSQQISHHIEQLVLDKKIAIRDINFFLPFLEKSFFTITTYLDTIFKDNRVNASTLSLIFKLFPHDLKIFYNRLQKRSHDIQFIRLIIESLQEIDTELSFEILQKMYSYSNIVIKQKILYAMGALSYYDDSFLLPILKKGTFTLRKEALRVAIKHSVYKEKALHIIFSVPFFLGINNRLIKENIQIIGELVIYEARPYLEKIAKKKLLWHKSIKHHARKLLEQWTDGKS